MLIDPAQALIESEKLSSSADNCQDIINKLTKIAEEIPSYWEGVSANSFAQNNQVVIDSLKKTKNEMQAISEEIKALTLVV